MNHIYQNTPPASVNGDDYSGHSRSSASTLNTRESLKKKEREERHRDRDRRRRRSSGSRERRRSSSSPEKSNSISSTPTAQFVFNIEEYKNAAFANSRSYRKYLSSNASLQDGQYGGRTGNGGGGSNGGGGGNGGNGNGLIGTPGYSGDAASIGSGSYNSDSNSLEGNLTISGFRSNWNGASTNTTDMTMDLHTPSSKSSSRDRHYHRQEEKQKEEYDDDDDDEELPPLKSRLSTSVVDDIERNQRKERERRTNPNDRNHSFDSKQKHYTYYDNNNNNNHTVGPNGQYHPNNYDNQRTYDSHQQHPNNDDPTLLQHKSDAERLRQRDGRHASSRSAGGGGGIPNNVRHYDDSGGGNENRSVGSGSGGGRSVGSGSGGGGRSVGDDGSADAPEGNSHSMGGGGNNGGGDGGRNDVGHIGNNDSGSTNNSSGKRRRHRKTSKSSKGSGSRNKKQHSHDGSNDDDSGHRRRSSSSRNNEKENRANDLHDDDEDDLRIYDPYDPQQKQRLSSSSSSSNNKGYYTRDQQETKEDYGIGSSGGGGGRGDPYQPHHHHQDPNRHHQRHSSNERKERQHHLQEDDDIDDDDIPATPATGFQFTQEAKAAAFANTRSYLRYKNSNASLQQGWLEQEIQSIENAGSDGNLTDDGSIKSIEELKQASQYDPKRKLRREDVDDDGAQSVTSLESRNRRSKKKSSSSSSSKNKDGEKRRSSSDRHRDHPQYSRDDLETGIGQQPHPYHQHGRRGPSSSSGGGGGGVGGDNTNLIPPAPSSSSIVSAPPNLLMNHHNDSSQRRNSGGAGSVTSTGSPRRESRSRRGSKVKSDDGRSWFDPRPGDDDDNVGTDAHSIGASTLSTKGKWLDSGTGGGGNDEDRSVSSMGSNRSDAWKHYDGTSSVGGGSRAGSSLAGGRGGLGNSGGVRIGNGPNSNGDGKNRDQPGNIVEYLTQLVGDKGMHVLLGIMVFITTGLVIALLATTGRKPGDNKSDAANNATTISPAPTSLSSLLDDATTSIPTVVPRVPTPHSAGGTFPSSPTPTPNLRPTTDVPTWTPTTTVPTITPGSTGCIKNATALYGSGMSNYRGTLATTELGYTCQNWDTQFPHSHITTPEAYPAGGLNVNYCRNPDGSDRLWCYTTNSTVRWDYCALPTCDRCGTRDGGFNQTDYRGTIGITESGKTCTDWMPLFAFVVAQYPSAGLEGNYCRNPTGEEKAYCFVFGTQENCNVPECDFSVL